MPKGNKLAYMNSPICDNTPVDYDDNKNMIELCMDVFNYPVPDLSKPEQVESAINAYFSNCINRGLRPGNMGLYGVLNLTTRQVTELLSGKIKLNANPLTIEYIKKAQKMLSTFRETLGSQGKLNPATLIFWQKNFDGLTDVQQIDLNPVINPQQKTVDEIEQEIVNDIPEK